MANENSDISVVTGVTDTDLLKRILCILSDTQIDMLRQAMKAGTEEGDALRKRIQKWRAEPTYTDPEKLRQDIMNEIRNNSKFDSSFFAELDSLMQQRGMEDAELYNAIGISQPLWSNIKKRGLKDYGTKMRNAHTKKENVLKMAIILHTDYFELYDLLCYGGFSFAPEVNATDHVVFACVRAGIYDPAVIDQYLVDAGEKALFSEE